MELLDFKNKTVADVVRENIATAHVFKKYGIDFCCGGGTSIDAACSKHHVDKQELMEEINHALHSRTPSVNYNQWPLDFLCDYIEQTHHRYVLEAIPIIKSYVAKVAKVHGHASPEVIEIESLFTNVESELIPHLQKEELILFPYIRTLVKSINLGQELSNPQFESVANPIRIMIHEHDVAGDLLKSIRNLSNNFQTPDWACNTYRALYAKLEEFENDLHLHIHLENNILFPKALKIEQKY